MGKNKNWNLVGNAYDVRHDDRRPVTGPASLIQVHLGGPGMGLVLDVKRGKPAPDPYLMGLQKAGDLQPNEAIVVENAPLGVRSGHAARIFTIAVNTGPLPNEVLLAAGANILFPTMPALAKAFETIIL